MMPSSDVAMTMVGKTIESVEPRINFDNDVGVIIIKFTDGSEVQISSTSYNYGPQGVCVD